MMTFAAAFVTSAQTKPVAQGKTHTSSFARK
jgi:hypothetical protein